MVGLGPGNRELLTPEALDALQFSQAVIGYQTYLDLVSDLLTKKEVVSSGMRSEVKRAEKAVELALEGKIVAVVSSGDPGIYGMAGIVLEAAPTFLEIEIIPGITAANAAAAVLGSPLMNDFALISLSDLLTPWSKIAKRLEAAGMGDYVVVLYNPKSKSRQSQIRTARDILLKHKSPLTPVGIVRSAKRGQETSVVTTLEDMLLENIDMLSVVVVGNSETFIKGNRIITPRGYKI